MDSQIDENWIDRGVLIAVQADLLHVDVGGMCRQLRYFGLEWIVFPPVTPVPCEKLVDFAAKGTWLAKKYRVCSVDEQQACQEYA